MNLVSGLLVLLASIVFGIAAFKFLVRLPLFALREVVVVSPMGHVTHEQLRYVIASSLRGNFFTVDLDLARKAFENLPRVRKSQLRRLWPGAVEVLLEEHVAVAYWRSSDSGDTRLVNDFGELFDAAANESMPVFIGPPDRSALMLTKMHLFNEILAPVRRKVVAMSLSGRHAWQLKLDDGLVIELGKDTKESHDGALISSPEERLRRFVALWPQIQEKFDGKVLAVADLRYLNGFAIRAASGEQGKDKR